jgi:hypothetical protein
VGHAKQEARVHVSLIPVGGMAYYPTRVSVYVGVSRTGVSARVLSMYRYTEVRGRGRRECV